MAWTVLCMPYFLDSASGERPFSQSQLAHYYFDGTFPDETLHLYRIHTTENMGFVGPRFWGVT